MLSHLALLTWLESPVLKSPGALTLKESGTKEKIKETSFWQQEMPAPSQTPAAILLSSPMNSFYREIISTIQQTEAAVVQTRLRNPVQLYNMLLSQENMGRQVVS